MTPDCPACSSPRTLKPHGAIVQECQWHVCDCCAKPVLIRLTDGVVLRVGKP